MFYLGSSYLEATGGCLSLSFPTSMIGVIIIISITQHLQHSTYHYATCMPCYRRKSEASDQQPNYLLGQKTRPSRTRGGTGQRKELNKEGTASRALRISRNFPGKDLGAWALCTQHSPSKAKGRGDKPRKGAVGVRLDRPAPPYPSPGPLSVLSPTGPAG